jgi:hypothetical protein
MAFRAILDAGGPDRLGGSGLRSHCSAQWLEGRPGKTWKLGGRAGGTVLG